MTRQTRLPVPPPLARTYVRYMLAFGISVAVGLAPLLGRMRVPGFTAIFDLMPVNVRDTLFPFAAFAMALPALAVQFHGETVFAKRRMARWFATVAAAAVVFLALLYVLFITVVAEVPYRGGSAVARYIVGETMTADCPCRAGNVPIAPCISRFLTFDPVMVESCYPPSQIAWRKIALAGSYVGLMLCFGTAIGLLVLRERGSRAQRK